MSMVDLKALHQKLCPDKHFGNFWKSVDYKSACAELRSNQVASHGIREVTKSSRNHPSSTTVHPLIALAFMRWADPVLFYGRINRIVSA